MNTKPHVKENRWSRGTTWQNSMTPNSNVNSNDKDTGSDLITSR